MNLYTERKVYRTLAEKLPVGRPSVLDAPRFSVVGHVGGIAAQRAAHFSIYGSDPVVAQISAIPDCAWDPATPEAGSAHGITWLRLSDLHHNARGNELVAAVLLVEDHLFVSITLSTTRKQVRRDDGEDENGVTLLLLALINHYPSLRALRFADDITRAQRDPADWALLQAKCKTRQIAMVLGGRMYDMRDAGAEISLGALALVGTRDDPERRHKLTGKRLLKYQAGGAGIAETQLPHGWRFRRDQHGRPITDDRRGRIPEAEPEMVDVVRALYDAHASGESYQKLAERMIAFEAMGKLRRRDHTDPDNTYARTADDTLARYDAAKAFFVRSAFRPRTLPSERAIARYLAGEEPEDVFDPDTRLYLAKVELIRTGRYFRRLRNDIRGRGVIVDGFPVQYRDDLDEYGWFDVLSEPWAWPVDDRGRELVRFGLPDQMCRQVAVRLLRELRNREAPTGGRAHVSARPRALQQFENWSAAPGTQGARYEDEATEWGVEARCNNTGKENFIVLFRRQSDGDGSRGRRGWSFVGTGERRPDHIAATGSLAELCASVSVHLELAARRLADASEVATLATVAPTEEGPGRNAVIRQRIEQRVAEAAEASRLAGGHRTMAALVAEDNPEEARRYAQAAAEAAQAVSALEAEIRDLHEDLAQAEATHDAVEDSANIALLPYVVVGLERAGRAGGRSEPRLASVCAQLLTGWRFFPVDDGLEWACDCVLPLATGGEVKLPLLGRIRDVRTRSGRETASTEMAIRYLMDEGRDLDDVARALDTSRKGLLVRRIMPWLVASGVTSRGAKCAIVDHPLPSVRRLVFGHLRSPAEPPANAYAARVLETYTDPGLQWGDAAVPDSTGWIAAAMRMLTQDSATWTHGLPVLDVALALGRSEDDVRELVAPQRRSAGFTRPVFLRYADPGKTRVAAIACPHKPCKGRRPADHVVLLPEVAASGFGVICGHCRRVPTSADQWPVTQYPPAYLESWTRTSAVKSLRDARQTEVTARASGPL